MTDLEQRYTGRWLNTDDWHGKEFSHPLPQYDHLQTGAPGSTPMRHVTLDQNGAAVNAWIPAHWSDEEARVAVDTNW